MHFARRRMFLACQTLVALMQGTDVLIATHDLQVEKLSADILARVLPEGIKL